MRRDLLESTHRQFRIACVVFDVQYSQRFSHRRGKQGTPIDFNLLSDLSESAELHRLNNIGVASELVSLLDVTVFRGSCQDDDRDCGKLRVPLYLAQEFQATDFGKF